MASPNDVEIEADRKAAEDLGCAVTLKSNHPVCRDPEKPSEEQKQCEEETRSRGRGQGGGRRRPRGPRSRPPGNFGSVVNDFEGSSKDNHATELESQQSNDSDKRVSPASDKHSSVSSPNDWEAGLSDGAPVHSHETNLQPQNVPKPREANRGQRSAPGRGHSRGPFAKFVTVPDASHSRDVRHVEEVNDSIVINVDRSTKPAIEPTRRGGRGGRGAGRGIGGKPDSFIGAVEDGADGTFLGRDIGLLSNDFAPPQRSSHRGRGRRSFRGQGDGNYFRGQGRGEGMPRGRGDGPRPFRGGYLGRRPRGGRVPRRATIVTPGGDGVQEEDWDKEMANADASESTHEDHGQLTVEDGAMKYAEGNEAFDDGHFCDDFTEHEGEGAVHQNLEAEEKGDIEARKQSEFHLQEKGKQEEKSLAVNNESHSAELGKPSSGDSSRETLCDSAKDVELASGKCENLKSNVQPAPSVNTDAQNVHSTSEAVPEMQTSINKSSCTAKTLDTTSDADAEVTNATRNSESEKSSEKPAISGNAKAASGSKEPEGVLDQMAKSECSEVASIVKENVPQKSPVVHLQDEAELAQHVALQPDETKEIGSVPDRTSKSSELPKSENCDPATDSAAYSSNVSEIPVSSVDKT